MAEHPIIAHVRELIEPFDPQVMRFATFKSSQPQKGVHNLTIRMALDPNNAGHERQINDSRRRFISTKPETHGHSAFFGLDLEQNSERVGRTAYRLKIRVLGLSPDNLQRIKEMAAEKGSTWKDG